MKLAVIFTPFPPPFGGIANWSNLVRKTLDSAGHSVTFVDTAIPGRDRFRESGVITAALAYLRTIVIIIASFPLLRGHSVVHCCTSWGRGALKDLLILLLTKLARRPVVFHYHFGELPRILAGSGLSRTLLTFIINNSAGAVVLDSTSRKAILEALPSARVFMIPNGVTLPKETQVPQKEKIITFAGWVKREKGIEDLLQAWQEANLKDWQLRVAGAVDPAYRNQLEAKFNMYGVAILGELPQPELFKLLSVSAVLVLPSYSEGFPFVVIEALARGCFVVSTDVGALPDMLAPGLGVQFKPGDISSLVNYLRDIASNPDYALLGAAGPSHVAERYSIESVTEGYIAAWNSAKSASMPFH